MISTSFSEEISEYNLKEKIGFTQDCFTYALFPTNSNPLSIRRASSDQIARDLAIKYMELAPFSDKKKLKEIQNEIDLHKTLDHPHILPLLDSSKRGELTQCNSRKIKSIYLVLPLHKNGDLFDLIQKCTHLSYKLSNAYLHQICSILTYLHEAKGIVHRDIKPENFLLDNAYNLKLIDFGLSASIPSSALCPNKYAQFSVKVGTAFCMSPELLHGLPYSGEAADVFATGVLLFQMICGKRPFVRAHYGDKFYKLIIQQNWKAFWQNHGREYGSKASERETEFQKCFQEMVCYRSDQRISLQKMKQTKFYKGQVASQEQIWCEIRAKVYKD
jgi:serine/threonine protein kinase